MQFHGTGNAPAIFLRNGGIVAFCGVDVFVSENVGYNVNITRFVIQSRAVRTAKFVRRDFLQRRYRFAVFDDWMSKQNFWKQFLSGVFVVIVMTGLVPICGAYSLDNDSIQK